MRDLSVKSKTFFRSLDFFRRLEEKMSKLHNNRYNESLPNHE